MPRTVARTRILKAAIRLFADRGYHGTTMEAIARGAKCSESMLHDIFHTKSELFLNALIAADTARLSDKPISRIMREDPDFEHAIRQVMTLFYAKIMDKTYLRLRLYAYLERPDIMREFFNQASLPYYIAIRERIKRERMAGKISKRVDADSAAAGFFFLFAYRRVFEQMGGAFPDFKITRRDMDHFAEVWLHGLLAL